jgi:hypothetical protein
MTGSILDLTDELAQRVAYQHYLNRPDAKLISFEQFTAQRWRGAWSEIGNSECAGLTQETYPTREEAMEAARKEAFGCIRGVQAWAVEAA